MNRFAKTTLVFIVLGAIVNIALAWGAAACTDVDQFDPVDQPQLHDRSDFLEFVPPGDRDVAEAASPFVGRFDAWGVEVDITALPYTLQQPRPNLGNVRRVTSKAGWPMRSLWGSHWKTFGLASAGGERREGSFPSPIRKKDWLEIATEDAPHPIPFAPLWSGFAINTALYGGLLWMLFAGIQQCLVGFRRSK